MMKAGLGYIFKWKRIKGTCNMECVKVPIFIINRVF